MIIAIDYDETYTVDPDGWDLFCAMFMDRGHTIICVSARNEEHMGPVRDTLGKVIGAGNCIGVNKQPKKQTMLQEYGMIIDVWIDDIPESIINGIV